jgi:hypothetical protein
MATPHLLMRINHVEFANLYARANNISDVWAAEVMVDSVRTLLVSIHINPNTSTDDIECFLLYNLMAYAPMICTMWQRLKTIRLLQHAHHSHWWLKLQPRRLCKLWTL